MRTKAIAAIIAAMATATIPSVAQTRHVLTYETPATCWNEALPIGNGRLGAMIFGTPGNEKIQLNEETIWAGSPNTNANPDARQWMPQIRELLANGKYKEAKDMANAHVLNHTNHGMPYLPFGNLEIEMAQATTASQTA